MVSWLIEKIEDWFAALVDSVVKNPRESAVAILAFMIAVPAMAQYLLSSFGIITHVSYIFACVYGFTRIIDNPYRPLIWGVGFAIGAVAVDLIFTNFIPVISGGDMVSVFSGLIILFVIVSFYLKSKELKSF